MRTILTTALLIGLISGIISGDDDMFIYGGLFGAFMGLIFYLGGGGSGGGGNYDYIANDFGGDM